MKDWAKIKHLWLITRCYSNRCWQFNFYFDDKYVARDARKVEKHIDRSLPFAPTSNFLPLNFSNAWFNLTLELSIGPSLLSWSRWKISKNIHHVNILSHWFAYESYITIILQIITFLNSSVTELCWTSSITTSVSNTSGWDVS